MASMESLMAAVLQEHDEACDRARLEGKADANRDMLDRAHENERLREAVENRVKSYGIEPSSSPLRSLEVVCDMVFRDGETQGKAPLLRNVGVPPEVSLAPAKGFHVQTAEHLGEQSKKDDFLGVFRPKVRFNSVETLKPKVAITARGAGKTTAMIEQMAEQLSENKFEIDGLKASLAVSERYAKGLEDVIADLKRDNKRLTDYNDRAIDASKTETDLLNSVGLRFDYGDFGDGPCYLRTNDAPRSDVRYEKANGLMLHWNGIPVYVRGLVGTHPDNWKIIRDGGK